MSGTMKRLIFFLIILLTCTIIQAQNTAADKEDIVYLKNGKTVKGIITKREFGTISIKVTDSLTRKSKVQIFQQQEISRIKERAVNTISSDSIPKNQEGTIVGGKPKMNPTQKMPTENVQDMVLPEQSPLNTLNPVIQPGNQITEPVFSEPVQIQGNMRGSPDDYFDPYSVPRPKNREKIWNRDIRGFRAFVDYAYMHGIGDDKNNRFEYAGSIGFQFNPIFYAGVGTNYSMSLNNKHNSLPVFINPRINFIDDNTTPFLDLRAGYSIAEGKGFYGSASFGVSFTRKGKNAFNLGVVYSFQHVYYYQPSATKPGQREKATVGYQGLGLKLSFEFGIGR